MPCAAMQPRTGRSATLPPGRSYLHEFSTRRHNPKRSWSFPHLEHPFIKAANNCREKSVEEQMEVKPTTLFHLSLFPYLKTPLSTLFARELFLPPPGRVNSSFPSLSLLKCLCITVLDILASEYLLQARFSPCPKASSRPGRMKEVPS